MKKNYKSILVNFLYNYFYQILLVIIPLCTSPYITRVFSTDSLGVYTYYYTIANYFVLFAMLGISNYGNRTIAMEKDNPDNLKKTFSEIFAIQIISSFIAISIYLGFLLFVDQEERKFVLITGLYVLSSLFDLNWLLFGLEKFKLTVTKNVIVKLITAILIFILIKQQSDIYLYSILICSSFLISNLLLFPYILKNVKIVIPKFKELKKHIKPILILFIPVIAVSVYKYMDKIMIGSMSNMSELTMYEYAEKIVTIPHGIVTALGTVMLPRVSAMIKKGENIVASKILCRVMIIIGVLTPAMAFGMCSISPELTPLFFEEDYEKCGIVVQYMSYMLIFIAVNNVIRTQVLIPYKRDIPYIIALCTGAIFNMACNILLIPRLGSIGAAIGTVIAEFVVFLVQFIFTRKSVGYKAYTISVLLSAALGFLMFIILRNYISFDNVVLEIVIRVLVGILLYCVPLFILIIYKKVKYVNEKS